MLNNFKKFAGVLFVFIGLIIAMGSEAPNLSGLQVMLQGFSGLFLMFLGMKIYPIEEKQSD